MNISRIALVSALIAALTLTVVSGAQQSASDYGGIDPAVALAWERAGARFKRVFELPGFMFTAGEAPSPAEILTLPVPAVPFGLEFERVLTESHLRALAVMPRLQAFICYDCDAANMKALAGLKHLESLRVQFLTPPSAEDLRYLSDLPRLRVLNTRYPTRPTVVWTDAHLAEFARLRQLEALSLRFSDLTDDGLTKLVGMSQLRWLDLAGTKVTAGGLAILRRFPHLRHLELNNDTLSEGAAAEIAKLTQLESLSLTYPTGSMDTWVKPLAGLVNLRELSLWTDPEPGLTNAGLVNLAVFTRLEKLALSGARITDAGLKALSSLRRLRVLDLNNTTVTDAGLRELAGFEQLADLGLNRDITDEGLRHLVALPRLQALRLNGNTRVTIAGLARLTTARPSLEIDGLAGHAVLAQREIDAAMATTGAEARLAALVRVRDRASVWDQRRIDQATLSTLVANWPDRVDRIATVLERVIAAIPSGSSPQRRMAVTLNAVQPLADMPQLAARIEQFMTAALVGVTNEDRFQAGPARRDQAGQNNREVRTRSAGLAVLGRARLAQGHVAQARTALEESLALLSSATGPGSAPILASLAQVEARDGRDARALDHYITAAVLATLTSVQETDFRALYRKTYGSDAGLEPALARRHRELFPNPVAPTPYVPSAARSTRVVLLELFTGSGCAPCVAADLAHEALLARYPADAVAAVAYHLSIPPPDPMVVTGGPPRGNYYNVGGVPAVIVDGRALDGYGGPSANAPKAYASYVSSLDTRLEAPAAAALSVNAVGDGDRVTVRARVAGLPPARDGLRLHILLVERELAYAGENGIRQHPMVVRAVAGADGAGIPIAGDGTTTHSFSLDAIRTDVETTLAGDIAARRKRGNQVVFPAEGHAQTTIDPSRLVVVAFIQQGAAAGDAPNVLQAAQADVVFGTAPKTEAGPAMATPVNGSAAAQQPAATIAAQKPEPVTWSIALAPNARAVAGGAIDVVINAKIDGDWHVYSMTQAPNGPSPLFVDVPAGQPFSLAGAIVESRLTTQLDPNFGMETRFFEKAGTLTVPVRIAPGTPAGTHALRITVDYQICSNRLCLPPATAELKMTVPVGGSTR